MNRHVALDSWRGIAAVMVALHHFTALGAIQSLKLVHNAYLFVDFFFVLSGFVIAANYRDRLGAGFGIFNFMVLRWGRLYALHLLMLALWIATELALAVGAGRGTGGRIAFTEPFTTDSIVPQLLLLQAIGLNMDATWNWVAWSISVEFWTYFVFACAAVAFAARLDRVMLLVSAAMIAFMALAPRDPELFNRWVGLARCFYGFAIGVLAYSAYRHPLTARLGRWSRDRAGLGFNHLEVAGALVLVGFVYEPKLIDARVMAPLAFGAVVLAYSYDAGWISRQLSARWLTTLGMISYSIYMIHPFVQLRIMKPLGVAAGKLLGFNVFSEGIDRDGKVVQMWGTQPWHGDVAAVLMLVLVIGLSLLTYRYVEEAFRDFVKGWRKQAVVVTSKA